MERWRKKLDNWIDRMGTAAASHRRARLDLTDPVLVPIALRGLMQGLAADVLVVTPDVTAAEATGAALNCLQMLTPDPRRIVTVPEFTSRQRREWVPREEAGRCAALHAALSEEHHVFVTSVAGLLAPVASPTSFRRNSLLLSTGASNWPLTDLAERLVQLDYDNEFEAHAPGEFARRGGIIDVFSPLYELPVRIEYFGDEIDSMRLYDPETQRSVQEVREVTVVPRGEAAVAVSESEGVTLLDYLAADLPVIISDPLAVDEHLERFCPSGEHARWRSLLAGRDRVLVLESEPGGGVADNWDYASLPTVELEVRGLSDVIAPLVSEIGEPAVEVHWQQLRDTILRWSRREFDIVACCGGSGEAERFREMVLEDDRLNRASLHVVNSPLPRGALFQNAGLMLLGEAELFGRQPRQTTRRRKTSQYRLEEALTAGADLEEGSYAVHASYGICLYQGLRNVELNGVVQEVMILEFAEEARLYLPLDQAHLVSRYAGGTKRLPKLSKLGTRAWDKARENAAEAAWDFAAELLRLDAMREESEGHVQGPGGEWERAFADACPFTETEDQLHSISDVLKDMESARPMDRLLCGDVGYGKTEVAMRAAFRAVMNGRQVAVLVPTTVLAQQHGFTFAERMAEYPIHIEIISRFRTSGEQRRILERVAAGQVDIIIGTHRLLQKDVSFHDLGLLIIDEEQRFGVKHKETLKRMRASVDILTMTATPIPRTLYFSMSGIRHLSTITTPPADRQPIKTVVAQYDAELVRSAIIRELERAGQVFFLHNRVHSIHQICEHLEELVPEARFVIGHGQMGAHELEQVMSKFIHGEADVLVSTTIIESGLDIPNANTIIIDRADRFGLADLYQLRGRVGRYNRQAYAYLLLPPMGALPQNARQRLSAIRRYTYSGAGFKLALRDLEIRGAGNILGTEQSGHIAAVGFELYCELLREAVEGLTSSKPTPPQIDRDIRVQLEFVRYGTDDAGDQLAAGIPAAYVGAENVRIECYRRLNRISDLEGLETFARELADRFGSLPTAVTVLLDVARIRVLARTSGIHSVTVRNGRVLLERETGLVRKGSRKVPELTARTPRGRLEETLHLVADLTR